MVANTKPTIVTGDGKNQRLGDAQSPAVNVLIGSSGGAETFVLDSLNDKIYNFDVKKDVIVIKGQLAIDLNNNVQNRNAFEAKLPKGVKPIYEIDDSFAVSGGKSGDGQAGNDTLTGESSSTTKPNVASSTLIGGMGNDLLVAGNVGNWLDGGTGDDTMQGGTGADTFVVDSIGDVINGADENDVIILKVNGTKYGDLQKPPTKAKILYNLNDFAAQILAGGSGNDTLSSSSSGQKLMGGQGNDLYIITADGVTITERVADGAGNDPAYNGGIDEVQTNLAKYALQDNVENLTYFGTGNFNGTGNGLANKIKGGKGNDKLYGGAGDDTLEGGAGNDWLEGGTGNNILNGGTGADTFVVSSAGDFIVGYGSDDLIIATNQDAFDGLKNSGVDNLNIMAANFTLTGGEGTKYNDTLSTASKMAGKAGDDLYLVTEATQQVVEAASGGTDTVRTSLTAYTLTNNVEKLVYARAATAKSDSNFTGTGNGENNTIVGGGGYDVLDGGAGNDSLVGGAGNDTLYGGDGDDTLDGGSGADSMYGSNGRDFFIVDNVGDDIFGLSEFDTVLIKVNPDSDLNFKTKVDNWAATNHSSDGWNVGKDQKPKIIYDISADARTHKAEGGSQNDTLSGTKDDDILIGGAGSDLYKISNSNVTILEDSPGQDTIWASNINFYNMNDKAQTVQTLIVKTAGNFTGYGNSNDNTIIGNAGNDELHAGIGKSLLDGGSGNDTLYGGRQKESILIGGTGDDWLTGGSLMQGGVGNDTLVATSNGAKLEGGSGGDSLYGDYTEFLKLVTEAGWIFSGGAGNDTISVTQGSNQIYGDDGDDSISSTWDNQIMANDQIHGGKGNDTISTSGSGNYLYGDEGDDWLSSTGQSNHLDGGAGNNTLTGDASKNNVDYFGFSTRGSYAEIWNFGDEDRIFIDAKTFGTDSSKWYQTHIGNDLFIGFDATTSLLIKDHAGWLAAVDVGGLKGFK